MKIFDIVRTEEGRVGYIITEETKPHNKVLVRFPFPFDIDTFFITQLKKIGKVKRLRPIKL